jgi:hypothetical protein
VSTLRVDEAPPTPTPTPTPISGGTNTNRQKLHTTSWLVSYYNIILEQGPIILVKLAVDSPLHFTVLSLLLQPLLAPLRRHNASL